MPRLSRFGSQYSHSQELLTRLPQQIFRTVKTHTVPPSSASFEQQAFAFRRRVELTKVVTKDAGCSIVAKSLGMTAQGNSVHKIGQLRVCATFEHGNSIHILRAQPGGTEPVVGPE